MGWDAGKSLTNYRGLSSIRYIRISFGRVPHPRKPTKSLKTYLVPPPWFRLFHKRPKKYWDGLNYSFAKIMKKGRIVPYSHYSTEDTLYFKKWLAQYNHLANTARPHEAFFMALIYCATTFEIDDIAFPSPNKDACRANDFSLVEMTFYLLAHLVYWVENESGKFDQVERGNDLLNYLAMRTLFLSQEATLVPAETLEKKLNARLTEYSSLFEKRQITVGNLSAY